jgi:hypothetical protein
MVHGRHVSVLAQTLEDGRVTEDAVGAESGVADVDDHVRPYPDRPALHVRGRCSERGRGGVEFDESRPQAGDACADERNDSLSDVAQRARVTDTE